MGLYFTMQTNDEWKNIRRKKKKINTNSITVKFFTIVSPRIYWIVICSDNRQNSKTLNCYMVLMWIPPVQMCCISRYTRHIYRINMVIWNKESVGEPVHRHKCTLAMAIVRTCTTCLCEIITYIFFVYGVFAVCCCAHFYEIRHRQSKSAPYTRTNRTLSLRPKAYISCEHKTRHTRNTRTCNEQQRKQQNPNETNESSQTPHKRRIRQLIQSFFSYIFRASLLHRCVARWLQDRKTKKKNSIQRIWERLMILAHL